jgi:KH domain
MAMPDDAPETEHVNGDDTHGDAAGVNNKRKAETEAPSESTPPVSKRNNHSAAAPPDEAAGAEPPGDAGADAGADAEQTGEERAEEEGEGGVPPPEGGGEGEPQAEAAPPPAHDPAYAAAAFAEPASMPEQAAPAVSGTVGYSMLAYDGVSGSYAFPVDHLLVGRIIGKGGDTIRQIQFASGAHIDINQQVPEGQPRMVCPTGFPFSLHRPARVPRGCCVCAR